MNLAVVPLVPSTEAEATEAWERYNTAALEMRALYDDTASTRDQRLAKSFETARAWRTFLHTFNRLPPAGRQ